MHEEHGNSNIPIKTDCEMSDMYFEESELLKELESLNTSKSPGFDEIHPVVLRGAKSVLVKAFVLLLGNLERNLSFQWIGNGQILLHPTNRGKKASLTITDQ